MNQRETNRGKAIAAELSFMSVLQRHVTNHLKQVTSGKGRKGTRISDRTANTVKPELLSNLSTPVNILMQANRSMDVASFCFAITRSFPGFTLLIE